MSNTDKWFEIIKENKIRTQYKVSSNEVSISFNFLQIPNTDTIVITVTALNEKKKCISVERGAFFEIMSRIECGLSNIRWNCNKTDILPEHFEPQYGKIKNNWYNQLRCHRVFFIPEECLWSVISETLSHENISLIRKKGVKQISVYVNTDSHDFRAKFY